MKINVEPLRDELTRLTEAQAQTDPRLAPAIPAELIQQILAYVQQERAGGRTLLSCAQELGLPKGRLHYWLYQSPRPRKSAEPLPGMRPVQVAAEPAPLVDPVPARRYTLRSPAGWELRELTLPEVVELLRSLP